MSNKIGPMDYYPIHLENMLIHLEMILCSLLS